MPGFDVKPLDVTTWPAYAELIERHNGVWGGCWCMGFHPEGLTSENRSVKEARVRDGQAHAALVFDGATCVGWCQFGPAAELPRIKRKRAYAAGATGEAPPEWRITCFFVDRDHRHQGVAAAALAGAVAEIERLGGGTVESFPENVEGRKVSSSFLHNGTVQMFEAHGFTRARPIGKDHWVVTRSLPAQSGLRRM
jgi:GNAT superfamily N-acetyltransferase